MSGMDGKALRGAHGIEWKGTFLIIGALGFF